MENKTPISDFSEAGRRKLNEMSVNNSTFVDFLKFQGRVFKHSTNVALEFFTQKPDTLFIATQKQWENTGRTIALGSEAIRFLDKNGNSVDMFDLSQTVNPQPPQVWHINVKNAGKVKSELGLQQNEQLIKGVIDRTIKQQDIISCMEALRVPPYQYQQFAKAYINNVQLVMAGRLETGGNKFNIIPDTSAFNMLQNDSEKLAFLTYVSQSARTGLMQIEKTINNIIATERSIKNDLRQMADVDTRGTTELRGQRISNNTERVIEEQHNTIDNDSQRESIGLGNNSTNGKGNSDGVAANVQNENSRGTDILVQTQSNNRDLQLESDRNRANNGGKTDRNNGTEMDRFHGEKLSTSRNGDEISTQVSDSSTFSRQESDGVQRTIGGTIREEESSPDRLQSDIGMGTGEDVLFRWNYNARNSISSNNRRIKDTLSDVDFSKLIHEIFDRIREIASEYLTPFQNTIFETFTFRLENFAIKHNIMKNIIDEAFEFDDFKEDFGSREDIDTKLGNNLDRIEKDMENVIDKTLENLNTEKNIADLKNVIGTDRLEKVGIFISDIQTKSSISENDYIFDDNMPEDELAYNFQRNISSISFKNSENQTVTYTDFDLLISDISDKNNLFFNNTEALQEEVIETVENEELIETEQLNEENQNQSEIFDEILSNDDSIYFDIDDIMKLSEKARNEIIEQYMQKQYFVDEKLNSKISTEINMMYFRELIKADILEKNGITISNIATKRAIGTDSEYFSDESLGQEDIAENFKECIKSIEFTNSAQQKAVYSDFDTLVNDLLDSNNTFFNNEKPLQLNLRFRDEEFLRNKALQHIANEMGTYFSINHILRLPEDKQDEIIEMCNNTEDGFDEDVERKINTEINIAYFKHSINAEKLEEKGIYISDIKTKSYIDTGINFQYDSTEDIDSAFEKNFESIEFTNSKNQKAIYRDYNSFVFDMTDSTNNFFNNGEISENEQLEFNESETQQKETNDVSKVDININNETEQPQEKEIKPKQNMNLSERLYEQFAKMFPDIVNGKHEYERYGSYDDESGYEPISVEYLGGSEYGFMTSYLQNGDVMRDPDFTFELDHENRTLTIHEYQQDGTPFGTLYQRVFDDNMNPDYDLLNSLGKNLMLNLKNAESANRPLTVYDDKNEQSYINVAPQISEETVNDDFSEEIIEPEIIVPQTPYSRISANISAIRELKRLERAEAEGLSEDEIYDKRSNQYNSRKNSDERLRGYSGWGGLSKVFDESSNNWQNREIQNLLTPDEYNAAKESTLNAHYTPEFIIDSMYKAIKNMELPRNSRILEPSCGVGRFISHMPSSLGNTEIVGVELDSITARIAKQLNKDNSNVRIINSGFEDTKFENGSFDLAIGNIPFGDYNLNDPDHAQNWRIHDAFFRKALDKVAAGGMVAFITSCGTLDKKNPKVREYLATQAELVGAIRLPDNAFSSAGTKTPTDIIFLKKRENPLSLSDRKPDWCYTTKNSDGLNINSYFIKNPQMILGKMEKTTHFDRLTCKPLENADIEKQLDEAIKNLNAKITVEKRESRIKEQHKMIEAWGKNYTFQVKNDTVYYRIGEEMKEIECSEIQKSMIEKLCNIRNITRQLLDMQKTPVTDEQLIPLRNELNNAYDQFVKEHGNLINKEIKRIFKDDSDFPIIQSLEKINSETEAIEKSDIFYRRTVNPIVDIKEVNTLEEAMQISLDRKEKPDILYMATLLSEKYPNKSISDVAEIVCNELLDKEYIFIDPEKQIPDKAFSGVTEKSEYLSGNVRMKLVMAQEHAKTNPEFERNVKALEKVIPEDIKAEEISVQMGCTWIDEEDYTDFLTHLSGRSSVNSRNCEVTYSAINGEYSILKAGSKKDLNVNETSTYGTADMSMYKIAERLLNQRRIVVMQYLPNPDNPNKKIARTDPKATKLAMEKAKLIKAEFKKWIFADPIRKEKYERRYNDIFNSLVGRSYDGSHLTFSGMKTGFNLRPHQKDCIARAIYGGNTLAAHVVGAGKSAVMFSTVMKKKELGLINKACVVVPKALTEQTASEWHRIFPDAKLLTVTNEDLATEEKRRLFTARVATGSYDAVIMSQEQFEKIPMSREYRIKFLQKEADALEDMLREKKSEGRGKKDATVLAIQAAKKKLITKINSLVDSKSASKAKDDLLEFEHLGFDYLVCDEAHAYKNGFVLTKMQNVAGVTTKASGRAEDMQMKTDYFNEQLGNGHILFCTGTPNATP